MAPMTDAALQAEMKASWESNRRHVLRTIKRASGAPIPRELAQLIFLGYAAGYGHAVSRCGGYANEDDYL